MQALGTCLSWAVALLPFDGGEFPDELRNFAGIVRRCERLLKTTNLVKRMVELRIPAFLEVSHSNLSGDEPAIVIARVEDHRDLIARDAAGKDHLVACFPVDRKSGR